MADRALESVDPTSGERLRAWPELAPEEIERRLAAAHAAARTWGRTSFAERGRALAGAAAELRARVDELALLMAQEMGKPVAQGRAEIEKCALACEHFAAHGAEMLRDEPARPPQAGKRELVTFQPLGVVLAIMPWNFPFWQVVRCAAPALMAGNVLLLKHAENVQGCAAALESVFRGLPAGAFTNLAITVARVPGLIRDARVAAVALTGSTRAGRSVGEQAGAALKKCVLELGGSDPYVVLADADLALAARTCVASRLINAGQSCIAAKRFIVVETARAEFTERFVAEMKAKRMGDPRTDVDLGPLARADLRDGVHDQVARSIARGARVLLGGKPPGGKGFFYPPTVLDGVEVGSPAYSEEIFGPVAAIVSARDEEHALAIANDTRYGLGAAVFTRDVERGLRIARERLEAGCVFVNDFVRSDPRLPFGGIKESGFGRELGEIGAREFVNVKTVVAAGG